MRYTPGPWMADWGYIVTEDRRKQAASEEEEGTLSQLYIAEICSADEEGLYIEDEEEQEANARLLAAAPQLAHELAVMLDVIEYLKPEKFDDLEHEANFNAQVSQAKALLAMVQS